MGQSSKQKGEDDAIAGRPQNPPEWGPVEKLMGFSEKSIDRCADDYNASYTQTRQEIAGESENKT
jgi:hypothetical protein